MQVCRQNLLSLVLSPTTNHFDLKEVNLEETELLCAYKGAPNGAQDNHSDLTSSSRTTDCTQPLNMPSSKIGDTVTKIIFP